MSEPTYRIELTHHPELMPGNRWQAAIFAIADDGIPLATKFGVSREEAFDSAQTWCKAKAQEPVESSTVFLTEDGEIHDPHDTTTLRSVS